MSDPDIDKLFPKPDYEEGIRKYASPPHKLTFWLLDKIIERLDEIEKKIGVK